MGKEGEKECLYVPLSYRTACAKYGHSSVPCYLIYPNVCNTLLAIHYGLLVCDEMFTTREEEVLHY